MPVDKLREQIKNKIKEKKLNIHTLERKSGLRTGVIRNIMTGASNNPGIVTLEAISDGLECSMDELVGKVSNSDLTNTGYKHIEHQLIKELTFNILDYTLAYIKKKGYEVSLDKLIFFIKESYIYFLEKNEGIVSQQFIEWFIDKNLD